MNATLKDLSIAIACLLDEPNDISINDIEHLQDLVTKLENTNTECDSTTNYENTNKRASKNTSSSNRKTGTRCLSNILYSHRESSLNGNCNHY